MFNVIISQELFTWLLAVNVDHHRDSSELGDGVRALWSWTIRSHSSSPPSPSVSGGHHHHGHKDGLDEVKGKLTSRFEVLKDEVQSVFPIIKVIHYFPSTSFSLFSLSSQRRHWSTHSPSRENGTRRDQSTNNQPTNQPAWRLYYRHHCLSLTTDR